MNANELTFGIEIETIAPDSAVTSDGLRIGAYHHGIQVPYLPRLRPFSGACRRTSAVTSKLDSLLDSIAPENTLDAVAVRIDTAVISFALQPEQIETWGRDEFEDFMGRFLRHIVCTAQLRCPPETESLDGFWAMFSHAIEKAYAPQGTRLALKLARTGTEGGIYAVMRKTAHELGRRWAHDRITSLISEYWESLCDKERQAAPGEYLQTYDDLLPTDVKKQITRTPWFHFPRILAQHPYIMQRMRAVYR
jgi:hypothetical protein